jgi:hypothetical protein
MEGFLRLRIKPWKRVALTRTLAMIPTLLVALFASRTILNRLNEWLNVLQSFQLPFALIPLLHFVAIPGIMGPFRLKGAAQVRKTKRRGGLGRTAGNLVRERSGKETEIEGEKRGGTPRGDGQRGGGHFKARC